MRFFIVKNYTTICRNGTEEEKVSTMGIHGSLFSLSPSLQLGFHPLTLVANLGNIPTPLLMVPAQVAPSLLPGAGLRETPLPVSAEQTVFKGHLTQPGKN